MPSLRFGGGDGILTFSPFRSNEELYSAFVSSAKTQASDLMALLGSLELERDLPPPGSQLRRNLPLAGL